MRKNRSASSFHRGSTWRRKSVAIALICALGSANYTAIAQDPGSNQATLNFVGADIDSVVKAVGHYTRTTFIIDPRVKGTINLVSEKPVTKEQAFQMLTSALRLQGYAVVRTDGYVKVVPEADAKLQAGPPATANVRGDQIATQVFRLNYENANNLVPVLRPLITPNNTVNANPGNNSIVITDYADNLKRLAKIIASLDAPSTADLDVVKVNYAVATDIAMLANRMLDQTTGTAVGASERVTLVADPRTNSVIVRASTPARVNLAKSLIYKLDQPTDQAGNVHVVYLKNANAVQLAQTLRAIVTSDTSAQGTTNPQQNQQQQQSQLNQSQQQGQAGLSTGTSTTQSNTPQQPTTLSSGGAGGYIQADSATNTLIITANETLYRNLRSVIDQLDSRRAQVYVESLIVEVTSTKASELGVQWLGLSGNSNSDYRVGGGTAFSTGGNNILTQLIGAQASTPTYSQPSNGLTLGIFNTKNGKLGLGALAHALESDNNTNILSMPNLVTLDNEEARIIVGQNVPFITGQYTTTASGASNPFQTIERRDIGLALRVRPQISEGGSIRLQIYQETSNIQDQTNPAGIITSKRSFESNVLVDDGQIIVLGGLIENSLTDTEEKVPVLGDIPVLGNLFKYKTRNRAKTNLMVFLRPTVMRGPEQTANVSVDRYDYIRGAQEAAQPEHSYVLSNGENPQLPPLIDGRPVGGAILNADPGVREAIKALPPAPVPTPAMPAPVTPTAPAPVAPTPLAPLPQQNLQPNQSN
jgi:general secretion pathway protein D